MTHDQIRDAVRQSAGMLAGTERREHYPRRSSRPAINAGEPIHGSDTPSHAGPGPEGGPDIRPGRPTICTCGHEQCDHRRSAVPLPFDVPIVYGACIMGCGCMTFTPEEGS